jgi:Uma2 family endonuclease
LSGFLVKDFLVRVLTWLYICDMTGAHQITYNAFTAMQIWKRIPEGVWAEVINDVLYVTPSPTPFHQEVTMTLLGAIYAYVMANKLGKIYPGPTDVYMDENRAVVIPDITFVSNENKYMIDKKGIRGAPDLLIEVYSSSTGKRDRTIKKNLYERMGVKEYWMVHPITKAAEGYLLENRRYNEPLHLTSKIHVRIFDKTFDL